MSLGDVVLEDLIDLVGFICLFLVLDDCVDFLEVLWVLSLWEELVLATLGPTWEFQPCLKSCKLDHKVA